MRLVAPALLMCLAVPAAAGDLYMTEKNGVIHITTDKPRRGKILAHMKGDRPQKRSREPAARTRVRAGDTVPAEYVPFVRGAAKYYALPEALLWAVMRVESGFNPQALSHKGAQGLMQLMPGTAGDMGVQDAWNPEQNIYGGARYLRILANKFEGDMVLVLSGYHAGGGAVDSVGGIPYEQTAKYVRAVLNHYYRFRKTPPQPDGPVAEAGLRPEAP
jgi:soluble lytic murein transglycosylase-like protein